ncbi:MAG: PTS sugar transporter subunit IIA [Eubacteriales bacterium]
MLNFLKQMQEKRLWIKAPVAGQIIQLDEVPDKVFAQKLVGDGIAIKPNDELVVSPVQGEIIQIFPTYHAICIKTREGIEILIHLGIETVKLKGEGFIPLTEKGQTVRPGDPLMKVNWEFISKNAESTISPIVITNGSIVKEMRVLQYGTIVAGQDLLMIKLNHN